MRAKSQRAPQPQSEEDNLAHRMARKATVADRTHHEGRLAANTA